MSLQALRDRYSKALGATKDINAPQSGFGALQSTSATGTNSQLEMAQLRCKDLEATLENTIKKNERLENECNQLHQYCRKLMSELQAKKKQIRRAETAQEQIDKLKNDNARLHKQLQAEKAANVGRLGWKQRERCDQDLDDSEPELEQTVASLPTPGRPLASAYSYGQHFPNTQNETTTPKVPTVFKMP